MGFGPSPKELSNDPSVAEALSVYYAERDARMEQENAMRAIMEGGIVEGGGELMRSLPGAAPWGFFDPLNLTPECQRDVLLWREAELAHGRVSMLAAIGFLVQESGFHPIMQEPNALAINQLGEIPKEYKIWLLAAVYGIEMSRANFGWVRPNYANDGTTKATIRVLKEKYQPGSLGFDPLGLKPSDEKQLRTMQEKELNNGRLAMIGVAGFVGQELVTSKSLF